MHLIMRFAKLKVVGIAKEKYSGNYTVSVNAMYTLDGDSNLAVGSGAWEESGSGSGSDSYTGTGSYAPGGGNISGSTWVTGSATVAESGQDSGTYSYNCPEPNSDRICYQIKAVWILEW